MFATTNNDLNISRDDGETWEPQQVKQIFPHGYCRGIVAKADDPRILSSATATALPARRKPAGLPRRRRDLEAGRPPETPNSTIWTFAVNRATPISSSPPRSTATSTAAGTALRPGRNAPTSSARCAPWLWLYAEEEEGVITPRYAASPDRPYGRSSHQNQNFTCLQKTTTLCPRRRSLGAKRL